ncbi:hypothetical protein [Simiduia agarivorans]|uniref:Lipoprotein n=1 Tax=Simiduia agarivorans (strain DSM 21679 / JCM 13881 / BCRC 17597 / SA1) TaxID=1117647 RepID=K4KGB6_SIMAS|nr:hypothetical protein [Simiduia agarivorans]AFU98134.1 hypothetical protein M5M_04635 [Simiduia agarivorans SA1 = DSM 21679]
MRWLCLLLPLLTIACTSVTVDEFKRGNANLDASDSVVILGRRHSSDYETEPDLVQCIGEEIASGGSGIRVIPELEFVNRLYPWFEPRIAPMSVRSLNRVAQRDDVARVLRDYGVHYIIWIDGHTETTNSAGSIGCSVGPGGAGCFGFGTWDKESDYEATIWDFDTGKVVGKISADASGTSYMPAIVVPIPLIARVQAGACEGLGTQLRKFLKPDS